MAEVDRELVAAARAAMAFAHAPYSRFAVGAAVRLADGGIVTGANFENASYGLSLCAETVAIATASAQGRLRDVVAVAVTGGTMDGGAAEGSGGGVVRPCGRCRQVVSEAAQLSGRDVVVFSASPDGTVVETRWISELLPDAFGPADLGIG